MFIWAWSKGVLICMVMGSAAKDFVRSVCHFAGNWISKGQRENMRVITDSLSKGHER